MDAVSYKRLCVSWLRLSLCQQQQSICSLFLWCRVRIVNQIDSLVKRQIMISADRGGVSDSAGLRVLLVRARLQELVFVGFLGSPPLEVFLGRVQKGPAVSKRSSDLLCVFYTGHVSHTVP